MKENGAAQHDGEAEKQGGVELKKPVRNEQDISGV